MKADHPLLKIAQNQSGLFTSQQAIKAGIDSRNHSYHLRAGNWSRVSRGVYQLNFIQEDLRREFFFLQLWTELRNGKQVGVFSYETALYLMGFKIDKPVKYHITVPANFRKNVLDSNNLILHYEDLNDSEKTVVDNLYITNIKKTFQDLTSINIYSPEWLKQQLKTAIEKKIISLEEVKNISVNNQFKKTFNAILFELCD